MRTSFPLLVIAALAVLSSCDGPKPTAMNQVQPRETKTQYPEDNIILSSEPSENVSLEDYWDEAKSIKTEARQVIQRASGLKCNEAVQLAKKAIDAGERAEKTKNFQDAENWITMGNEALSLSEDALAFCENRLELEEQK